jgi:hypothetical protein
MSREARSQAGVSRRESPILEALAERTKQRGLYKRSAEDCWDTGYEAGAQRRTA